MKKLSPGIENLRKSLNKQKEEDQKMREILGIVVASVVDTSDPYSEVVKDFYLKNKTLYIITRSKALASELFFQKEEILKQAQKASPKIADVAIL